MSLLLSKFFGPGQPGKLLLAAIQSGEPEIYAVGLKGSAPALLTSLLFDLHKQHILYVTASIEEVVLSGEGASFCSGGDLDEFGSFPDPSVAPPIQ